MLCWRWSEDLRLCCLWHWLDLTGLSREERVWREEESVRQVSSNLTRLRAIPFFRWLFVTVNYLAFLLQCHCKIKKQGFDANCCFSISCHNSLKGPKHFLLHCGYSNEQFHTKPGQCTMTGPKELKQDDISPLSPVLSKHLKYFTNLDL